MDLISCMAYSLLVLHHSNDEGGSYFLSQNAYFVASVLNRGRREIEGIEYGNDFPQRSECREYFVTTTGLRIPSSQMMHETQEVRSGP
jgi:hypothetical protein